MTRRRWIADHWNDTTASLKGDQATHLLRVLRAQIGMEFDIVAGDRVWRAAIKEITRDTVDFTLLSPVQSDPALPVTLLISIFKFDRMEWIIEKATELGAERLIPVIARRSEKHLVQGAPGRLDRWRRIAREAAKQSRRSDLLLIGDVTSWKEAAGATPPQSEDRRLLRLFLAEQDRSTALRTAIENAKGKTPKAAKLSLELAIGPEGGWTTEEQAVFTAGGWEPASLGPRILRTETAGIAAIAVAAALLD